jgi:hypothetical protein
MGFKLLFVFHSVFGIAEKREMGQINFVHDSHTTPNFYHTHMYTHSNNTRQAIK